MEGERERERNLEREIILVEERHAPFRLESALQRTIGLGPNKQRQRRTSHAQKDVLL